MKHPRIKAPIKTNDIGTMLVIIALACFLAGMGTGYFLSDQMTKHRAQKVVERMTERMTERMQDSLSTLSRE